MEGFQSFIVVHSLLAAFSAVVTMHDKKIFSNGQLHGVQIVQGRGAYLEDEMTLHVRGFRPARNELYICMLHNTRSGRLSLLLLKWSNTWNWWGLHTSWGLRYWKDLFSLHIIHNLNSSIFCLSLGPCQESEGTEDHQSLRSAISWWTDGQ